MSENELKKLTKEYTYAIRDIIGPFKDIPAPDMFTNAQTMAWIAEAYSQGTGRLSNQPSSPESPFTSGARSEGPWRPERALFFVLEEASKHLKFQLSGKKVAILGFGNVGSSIAKLVHQAGCQIIALTDMFGGIYNEKGIDPV